MKTKTQFFLEGFSIDLRSLALFRITFGLCLFVDVFYRIFYINDFYTDTGVLPREALIGNFLSDWESSLLLISGQPAIIFLLMATTLLFISMFIVGYRTRLAAFLTWILVTSIHTRAQVILHGGDDLIRVLLFWCQFVPLAAEFSVDRYLHPQIKPTSKTLLSFGSAGLLLQLMFMYIFTAALKFHPVWIKEGSAIYYALNLEQFTDTIGQWLLHFPQLMKSMTFATLLLELVGPVLVLTPFLCRYFRTAVALSFIGFHFGLFVTLHLGPFPWTCMAAWTMVFPASFWDRLKISTITPFYKLVDFFKKNQLQGEIPRFRFPRLLEGAAAFFIVLMFLWNLSHHDWFPYQRTESFRIIMNVTELYQKWNMFAPYPRKDDGWYVIEAQLFNGKIINPLAKNYIYTLDKPEDVAATYKNSMWRKYLTNSWLKQNHKYRVYFGRYLCRQWNRKVSEQNDKINTIKIYYMLEMTPAPGQEAEPTKKELLWRHYCFDKPQDWDS
jgi:hypothetical protein